MPVNDPDKGFTLRPLCRRTEGLRELNQRFPENDRRERKRGVGSRGWRQGGPGRAIATLFLGACIVHCGGRSPRAAPVDATIGATQEGIASWYGHPYHGRQTSNGEIYDQEADTAAHKTLPFNTWVKVTNLSNRRTTKVRINDRGPFVEGRIIDLSRRAAREIGMLHSGITRVRIEIVETPRGAQAALFAVQVGAFRERSNAERLRQQLAKDFDPVYIEQSGPYFRVRVGRLESQPRAEQLAARLRRRPGVQSAVVVRVG